MILKGRMESARQCNPTDCILTVDLKRQIASFKFCPLHEAAPELYAALLELAEVGFQAPIWDERKWFENSMKAARSALAKARGEQTDAK